MSVAGAGDDQPATRRTPEDRARRASRLASGPALGHPSTRRETAVRLWGSIALVVVSLVLLAVFVERVTVFSLLVGAVGLPAGLVSAARWWRVRRRLARARFEPADARVVLGRHERITVHVRVAGEDVVLRRAVLLPPGIWREVSALAQWPGGPCWVARSRGRRWVLATPGGSDLWRMTTARPGRQAERWARQDAGRPS